MSLLIRRRPVRASHIYELSLCTKAGRRWNHDTTQQRDGLGANSPPAPLKGIKVLDLTRVLAGPTATMLLADMGADVIKVEQAERGDDTRSWLPPQATATPSSSQPTQSQDLPPESTYFLSSNRNKRSLTLNFKHPLAQPIIKKLVERADVVVENFVPGKLKELGVGLSWEEIQQSGRNEGLVYCSISGYGQTGPYSKAAGYDVVIEAEAGLMHITGEPDGRPNKVGVAVTDISTGLYAHGAIIAALYARDRNGGKGCWIDCNLFETQIAGLANVASAYLNAGVEGARHGTSHPSIVPYQVFPCGADDGSGKAEDFLMIGAGNDKQFKTFATQVLQHPILAADSRFLTNTLRVKHRDELVRIISEELMKEPRSVWLERFKGKGIPFGPINNIGQTFEHPQALARKMTVEVDHPRVADKVRLPAHPVHYNGVRPPVRMPPPWLGEHTEEILVNELGFSADRVKELRELGVV